ncbi:hypothetical protein WG66_010856 [Moniliophthora roreri]|uniref:Uncharacterized protein n=1 Tax=Moniliophthora roreri TaxID=221103 RepID=A0A0W0G9K9_MONRR|nr:hypothetical protein WG66_010856 [Moniliophthora roreri]
MTSFNTGQTEVKHTEHDEFEYVKRGHVISVKDLRCVEQNWALQDKPRKSFRRLKAKKTICLAEIHPDRQSKYTVIMYEGEDAEHVWEEDFQRFSRTKYAFVTLSWGPITDSLSKRSTFRSAVRDQPIINPNADFPQRVDSSGTFLQTIALVECLPSSSGGQYNF